MERSQVLFEMEELDREVKSIIREVEGFPKEGINFKDITTLLSNPVLNAKVLRAFEKNAEKCINNFQIFSNNFLKFCRFMRSPKP